MSLLEKTPSTPEWIQRLSQSERQRYLQQRQCSKHALESDSLGSKCSKVHAAKIVECPQNILETRRMLQRCQSLDRAKFRALSKINSEQVLVRARYKEIMQEKGDESNDKHAGHSLSATFLQQPGFRYRSNGDERDRLASDKVLSSKKSRSKTGCDLNLSIGSYGDLSDDAGLVLSHTDIKQQLQTIQDDLLNAKDSRDIQDLRRKLKLIKTAWDKHAGDEVVQRSLTKVPSNMSKFPLAMRFSGELLKKSSSDLHQQQRAATKRFSKQCTRRNCVACQFRLKCHVDDTHVANQVSGNRYIFILLIVPYFLAQQKNDCMGSEQYLIFSW